MKQSLAPVRAMAVTLGHPNVHDSWWENGQASIHGRELDQMDNPYDERQREWLDRLQTRYRMVVNGIAWPQGDRWKNR